VDSSAHLRYSWTTNISSKNDSTSSSIAQQQTICKFMSQEAFTTMVLQQYIFRVLLPSWAVKPHILTTAPPKVNNVSASILPNLLFTQRHNYHTEGPESRVEFSPPYLRSLHTRGPRIRVSISPKFLRLLHTTRFRKSRRRSKSHPPFSTRGSQLSPISHLEHH